MVFKFTGEDAKLYFYVGDVNTVSVHYVHDTKRISATVILVIHLSRRPLNKSYTIKKRHMMSIRRLKEEEGLVELIILLIWSLDKSNLIIKTP